MMMRRLLSTSRTRGVPTTPVIRSIVGAFNPWTDCSTPSLSPTTVRFFSSPGEGMTSIPKLFDKVMVANRGEIAERVFTTCKKLGIKTVAIYSTADAMAPFCQLADEAICVGPASAAESYLNTDAVLAAMKKTGAQAIHPGYGFLSENASFCQAVQEAGGVFLGPPVSSITKLGDKLESKRIAVEAGVTTIPGYDGGPVDTVEHALQLCNDGTVPYPVLLKAANGGGGKGMRVCYNDQEIRDAWGVAKGEALKFFKDDRLLLEKFIEQPHHIEFQIIAAPSKDGKGTDVVVFPERECSIQRRNQKVIEETPSVLLKEETRQTMADQVRRLCQAVGYQSAGTVEFLVDEKQHFYFLEMNTRLQVEHPITEAITGVDLVEAMLYIGAGKGLPEYLQPYAKPGTIVPYQGHAMEARVYAEDPLRGFLPSTGPLLQYVIPSTNLVKPDDKNYRGNPPYIRLDSGVVHGHNVSPHYDPMLSKLVSFGPDRLSSIAGLRQALDEYVIEGVQHNARLVQSVLREPDFVAGATPTSFLPAHYPDGFTGVQLTDAEKEEFAVAGTLISLARQELLLHPPLAGFDDEVFIVRLGGQFGEAYRVILDADEQVTVSVQKLDDHGSPITDAPRVVKLDSQPTYQPVNYLASLTLDGAPRTVQVLRQATTGEIKMQMYGAESQILVQSAREYELTHQYLHKPIAADTTDLVLSPMPGLLLSYAVSPGDSVQIGQELCIVESMKMQNMIRSPRAGVIATCAAKVGSSLAVDEVILTFESAPAATTEEDVKKAAA